MNIKMVIIYSYCAFASLQTVTGNEIPAITVVPVADLVGNSLQTSINPSNACAHYSLIPFCGHQASSCLRLHQLLFNERVTILEEKGQEVCVKITNLFFEPENSTKQYNTFWSLRSNFLPIEELTKSNVPLHNIPPPIALQNNAISKKTVTLTLPWHDKETNLTYSAGTRFMISHRPKKNLTVAVYAFDPSTKKLKSKEIPLAHCHINGILSNEQQKIEAFVDILKKWAHLHNGFIPYVWGGISFTNACHDSSFVQKTVSGSLNYSWPSYAQQVPKSGFDCTGLVARAAQIVDIPYYYKNTTTLAKYLEPIGPHEIPTEGDLIWFSGHVLVVSDCKKNTIIEARSYGQGFGKIHELPLSRVFKDINSIQDLADAFHQKKSLERLNSLAMPVQHITHFKIFSLKSVWRNNIANAKRHS